MKKNNELVKKGLAIILALVLTVSLVPDSVIPVNAATGKVKLNKKTVTVSVGKKKTIILKKVKHRVVWKIVYGKKNVSIKKKGKYKQKIVIKGRKVGNAKIKAIYGNKKFTLKVKLKANEETVNKSGEGSSVFTTKSVESSTVEVTSKDKENQTEKENIPVTSKENREEITTKEEDYPIVTEESESIIESTIVPVTTEIKETTTQEETTTKIKETTKAPETTTQEETTTKIKETTKTPETRPEETTTKIEETTKRQEVTTEFHEEAETEEHPKNINVDSYISQVDAASSTKVSTSANEGVEKLFDGNINTKMCTLNGFPLRIAWQMEKPIVLKKYTLTTANDSAAYSYRNPKVWHLYGSNNGTSWTQIDTVTDSGIEAKNLETYTYETDVQKSFQYFLIQFEGNGTNYYGFQLAEISLHGDIADVTDEMGDDLMTYFESVYNEQTTAKGNGNEIPANIFDSDITTKLFEFSGNFSIAWKMKQETILYSYSLTTANDNATYKGRNPKSWILYGSKDGYNWEEIDVVNESGMEDENYKTYNYAVDKTGSYKYYKMDVKASYGNSIQLSEIALRGATVSPSKYDILFTGDWNDVTVDGYLEELTKLFYNSYPRLYQRWGNGTEPTTITFKADKNYSGVAYCQGTTVCVSTKYANSHPTDIGFFSHEITHSVQQYSGKLNYGDDVAWWTENMANYGGFRYFHWSNPKYVQVYEATDETLQDWGYEQYGNNKWFFAYMDSRYPTRKNADETLKYGLIDSINKLIKDNNTGKTYTDDPYDTTTPFNNVVKQITGYDCIESLRKKYVEELKAGTWTFKGFANYEDNWVTENIDGIANPEYPMVGEKIHGNKTAAQLNNTVSDGTNLCLNGKVYECSGYTNDNESADKLIDGKLDTKWCATSSNVTSGEYSLNGVKHWVKIDLGKEQEFNTYTIYNTKSKEGF